MLQRIKEKLPSLTIAIPAYNEEASLGWVLENTLKEAPLYLADFEILVINDGSSDKTGKIAEVFAKKDNRVRVIHQKNGGYGVAMLRGIKKAKKEFVAFMPADGQFLVKDMTNCFPLMREADLILGYRGTRADYTLYRLILSYTYLLLLRLLFDVTYKDVNWLNIWRTGEVQRLKINSTGIFLLAEIVIRFRQKGLKIVEEASFYRPRRGGEVKHANFKVARKTFVDMLKFWVLMKKAHQ